MPSRRRLIVVSNRAPVEFVRQQGGAVGGGCECRGLEVALTMNADERRRRLRRLDRRIATHDLAWWTRSFLDHLGASTTATAA